MDCSEHKRCKTVCVKSDIKLLILKTLMIFKFRFLGWRTGLSKATHMKSLIVWGWAVRGSIPCVSYIRHQTDFDLQDIVNDTHHLFGDIQVLVLVWILFSLLACCVCCVCVCVCVCVAGVGLVCWWCGVGFGRIAEKL